MDDARTPPWREDDIPLILTHHGEDCSRYHGAVVPPVYMNSLNVFPTIDAYYDADRFDRDTYVYGRLSNPTVAIAEDKLAALEHGAWAAMFASGMAAAAAAVLGTCRAGSHVVCVRNAYGPMKELLDDICTARLGMRVNYVAGTEVVEFEAAVTDATDLVVLESPSSVMFTLQDIAAVGKIAQDHGARVYIDNTYCTPLYQNPLDLGADLVMHTASKYLGGHSDLIGGVLVGRDEALKQEIFTKQRELFGGIIGPMEGWLVLRGLRTLQARLEQHRRTATEVAHWLHGHPKIRAVHYPGLASHPQHALAQRQQRGSCGLLSFEVDGTAEQAKAVVNALRLFQIGVSWGGFESLACMPYLRKTARETAWLGGGNGLIRIHCGLEGAQHLLADLDQALAAL